MAKSWKSLNDMAKHPLLFFWLAFSYLISVATAADTFGKSHASWWVQNYGVVAAAEQPLVNRAERVFVEMAAASDKRGNRLPRLLTIRGKGDPFALAIEDGTIILTEGCLKICYRGVSPERGDARLAFIFGHELAHLARDDFWHLAAFMSVRDHTDDADSRSQLMQLLRSTSDIDPNDPRAKESARLKELQADSYALLYMTIADYDPEEVVSQDGSNFFEELAQQITSRAAYEGSAHPSPKERAALLRSQVADISENLDLFRFGVRLYQLGRYEDAILLLEEFAKEFPSREVYNDLGLSHFQMALRVLGYCNRALVTRFKLSTLLDPDTLASILETEDQMRSSQPCLQLPEAQSHLKPAITYLEHAAELDPDYIPARLNLSSLYIVTCEYSKALAVLDEIKEKEPNHGLALNNRAVALYLFGADNSIDMMDQAVQILQKVTNQQPGFSDAFYNLGSIEGERGRNASARAAWDAFLRLEPTGPYANVIRNRLELKVPSTAQKQGTASLKSPIPLGEIQEKTVSELRAMKKQDFRVGTFQGQIYHAKDTKLLVIEDVVEIVESRAGLPSELDHFKKQNKEPLRVVLQSNKQTLIYSNFAADVSQGKVIRIAYFEPGL